MATSTKPSQGRYVQVERNIFHAGALLLAAHVLDDVREGTGWQLLAPAALILRIVAVVYVALWLLRPKP